MWVPITKIWAATQGRPYRIRVFFVLVPAQRVVYDIIPYFVQAVFVPDDVFVIIALPEFPWKWGPMVLFYGPDVIICGHCFEPIHDIA